MSTIKQLLDYGKEQLMISGNEYAKYERKVLLENVLCVNYMYMLANSDESVSADKENKYKEFIKRRCEHYPLQYILGFAHFMDYTFFVDENVLIPRSDTEILVELANDLIGKQCKTEADVLDLCCGSGCIGISLKLYNDNINLYLSDISQDALNVCRKNIDKYNVKAMVNNGNLFEGIDEKFNLIVCNPPYIESAIVDTLMPEVKDFEPRLALDGGEDGLDIYKEIIKSSTSYLHDGATLMFEIGYNQGKAVSDLMKQQGFSGVEVHKDYAGKDRVVFGHL
ncbi:MAG: peptide chain release factor N(5)-glutamine methyltransferase [Lachnospiraceae bacterium]|jgi:release factor glutamine methyltransferase|nr:peptide chain release factor N(5)-glutamine methyltransferase [Lachnospiraceae bacterium]